jgi:hypothetical protein
MNGKIVIVKKEEHANLDSFPFRYGFSSLEDFNLLIQYDSKPIIQKFGSQERLRVNNAKFTNPISGLTEEGSFVLIREHVEDHYRVVTVIRKDQNVEKSLSDALKIFRKHKYVSVEELVNYFHPLYMGGEIKTHNDLKKYLIELNSDNQDKLNEMELVLTNAYKKIDLLEEENKLLIDKANNDITKRYYEKNGQYEIDMFHNLLSRVREEVAESIRFLNPNAKFRITTSDQIFESFYESERNKKVVAIIHPYDFNENSIESILPLIEWKDPKAINPSKNEIIAQINKVREEGSKEMRALIATFKKKNEQEEIVF